MKLLNCKTFNFASYQTLEFDFSDTGLALVYGPTGAGKSTVMDLAAWALYGITAKEGAADDVRSWQSEEATVCSLTVQTQSGTITVHRTRGTSKQNDLYWQEEPGGEDKRGKDLNDTQKLLETRLGVSADLFLTASYYHEFSKTGTFFISKAKDRRQVFEEIADLTFPIQLAAKASSRRKEAKLALDVAQGTKDRLEGRLEAIRASIESAKLEKDAWNFNREKELHKIAEKSRTFEEDKLNKIALLEKQSTEWEVQYGAKLDFQLARVEDLQSKVNDSSQLESQVADWKETVEMLKDDAPICDACGQSVKHGIDNAKQNLAEAVELLHENQRMVGRLELETERLSCINAEINPYTKQVIAQNMVSNFYEELLETERKKSNPFEEQLAKAYQSDIVFTKDLAAANKEFDTLQKRVIALTQLYDLCSNLRGELLKKAVKEVESETNRYLEKYFDAEIRVGFTLGSSDSLDVSIQKSGYECNFKQLSKGQRSLLKLTFSLAVQQAAANKAGVHFDNLFLDEPTDGQDSELKLKSYALFEELSTKHANILVIDHDKGLQTLFTNKYRVELEGDYSKIEIEND